jgi:hypothetical protein
MITACDMPLSNCEKGVTLFEILPRLWTMLLGKNNGSFRRTKLFPVLYQCVVSSVIG